MENLRRDRRAPGSSPQPEAVEPQDVQPEVVEPEVVEPVAETTEPEVQWSPAVPIRKGYGGSALSFSLAGLAASFFVGWAFPLAVIGMILGIFAIRKREESTQLGVWAIGLGTLALVYSVGWLLWAAAELHWFR